MGKERQERPSLEVVDGEAALPDAEDAPDREDLAPEDPPPDAPTTGDTDQKSAVPPPVPAHGEMASPDQIAEATAAEIEDRERS